MEEALNGFSVVFSGAMHVADAGAHKGDCTCVFVNMIEEIFHQIGAEGKIVPVWC
jgi:hypothetical protein